MIVHLLTPVALAPEALCGYVLSSDALLSASPLDRRDDCGVYGVVDRQNPDDPIHQFDRVMMTIRGVSDVEICPSCIIRHQHAISVLTTAQLKMATEQRWLVALPIEQRTKALRVGVGLSRGQVAMFERKPTLGQIQKIWPRVEALHDVMMDRVLVWRPGTRALLITREAEEYERANP